jgi:hypothetical protein
LQKEDDNYEEEDGNCNGERRMEIVIVGGGWEW